MRLLSWAGGPGKDPELLVSSPALATISSLQSCGAPAGGRPRPGQHPRAGAHGWSQSSPPCFAGLPLPMLCRGLLRTDGTEGRFRLGRGRLGVLLNRSRPVSGWSLPCSTVLPDLVAASHQRAQQRPETLWDGPAGWVRTAGAMTGVRAGAPVGGPVAWGHPHPLGLASDGP